jgi:hypothetical protein
VNANGGFKAHDGCVARRVIRHDGRVLVDEILSAE